MERNYWKLATIGIALTGVTALSTGLTTAWMLRPAPEAQASVASVSPSPARLTPAVPRPALAPAVAHTTTPPRVTRVSTAAVPADCDTGGERAMRIAKPGVIGALLGAGLGAAGGAVAKGGDGAGKGAIIGGLAGAALGTGYGAYKTQNECGTIFGSANGFSAAPASQADRVQALAPAADVGGDRIQVYGIQR
jgi:hypothetical protein